MSANVSELTLCSSVSDGPRSTAAAGVLLILLRVGRDMVLAKEKTDGTRLSIEIKSVTVGSE